MDKKTKNNYKLGIAQRNTIIQLIKENKANKEIVEHIKDHYGIEITSGYISQIRQKAFFFELSSYNKDIERKLRSKMKIDNYLLHITEKGYYLLDNFIKNIQNKELSAREAFLISGMVNQAHKIYMELNKNTENRDTVSYNIRKALGL